MNILVIEDNELKFKQIEDSLNRILDCPNIVCMKSRNSGLVSLLIRNVKGKLEPYDLVITDNYLPLDEIDDNDMFECEEEVLPFAKDIVDEIRRMGLENLPIVVCSSDDIEECDFNYRIKYNSSVSLDKIFQVILCDIVAYKKLHEETKDCRSCQNMSCRVETKEKPVEDCLGYIHHKEKINKTKLNYMSAISKTQPVARIPVDGSKLVKLDMSIREKCRQNHLNDHILDDDEIYYTSNSQEQSPVKKLTKNNILQ